MKRTGRIKARKPDAEDRDRERTRQEYRDRFEFDEWIYWLGYRILHGKLSAGYIYEVYQGIERIDPLELNHLWRRTVDARSNYIRLAKAQHDWFHAHLPAGRVMSVAAKLRKRNRTGDPGELILFDLNEAAGNGAVTTKVLGIVSGYSRADLMNDSRIIDLVPEVLDGLTKLEREARAA